MDPLAAYRGAAPFGPAYAYMFAHDTHAEGSVDRWLTTRMVWLCSATVPYLYRAPEPPGLPYVAGSRPALEARLVPILAGAADDEGRVCAIAAACAAMVRVVDAAPGATLDDLRFGGTEEEIAQRGSSWCTDVARLACRLCQVAGLPARIVTLADTGAAYSGHEMIEVWRSRVWGAVDPTVGVVYRQPDGRPATTWELMRRPDWILAHRRGDGTPYTIPEQFRGAAVAEYPWDAPGNYAVTGVNPYCRRILDMGDRGWPGGLRWLHGEDRLPGDGDGAVHGLSAEEALAVAEAFARELLSNHPSDVVAVVLVGSLATGDYMPGRSDIDTVVILRDGVSGDTRATVRGLADAYRLRHGVPKGFGAVRIKRGQLAAPLDPVEELAPEIQRLREQGRVLAGQIDLAAVRVPTTEDLRAYCRVFIPWLRGELRDPDRPPENRTADALINGTLYEIRAAILSLTGRYVLDKRAVVPALLAADPSTALRAVAEDLHAYLLGQRPAPSAAQALAVRQRTEAYVDRVAPWIVGPRAAQGARLG